LERLSTMNVLHATDIQASYSNLAYSVLGNVLSEYIDMDYETALNTMILEPLGTTHTGLYLTKELEQYAAVGYNSEYEIQYWTNLGWGAPAGQIFSSVHDLGKLMAQFFESIPSIYSQELNTDPNFNYIAEPQTLREMLRPVIINPDKQSSLGAPWEIQQVLTFWPRTKGGNVNGFSSNIALVPELRLGVIGLTNFGLDGSILTLGPLEILIPAFESWLNAMQAAYVPSLPKFAPNAAGDYYYMDEYQFTIEMSNFNGHPWLMVYALQTGEYGALLSFNTTNNNNDHKMFYKSFQWDTENCWLFVFNGLDGMLVDFDVNEATNEVYGVFLPDNYYGDEFNLVSELKYYRREKIDIVKHVKNRKKNKNNKPFFNKRRK